MAKQDKPQPSALPEPAAPQPAAPAPVTPAPLVVSRPAPQANGVCPLTPAPAPGQPRGRMATSLDLNVPVNRRKAYSAVQSQDLDAADMIGKDLLITDWLAHDVQIESQADGEMLDCVRTVLILSDGRTVGSVSDGILNGIRALANFNGPAPWCPPIKCRILQKQGRGANRYYVLEWVE